MNTPQWLLQKNPALAECSQTSIEDLQEGILINILSFLPTTASVKTTAIAPRWHNLWHFVPILDFDIISFHSNIPDISIQEARELFAAFINQTLIHRPSHIPLKKFRLQFCNSNNVLVQSCIDSWLRTVIGCKVAEVDLTFLFQSYLRNPGIPLREEDDDTDHLAFGYYSPQFPDFSDSSVEVLKLHGVDFRIPEEALSLKFDSIREVHLKHFCSSDKDIERLMASCVNLESLSLSCDRGCEDLKIVSEQLKHFKLFYFNLLHFPEMSVEICAPNLESINLGYISAEKFSLRTTPSLVEAKVIFLHRSWWDLACWTNVVSSLSGIERLTIQNMWPWSLYFQLGKSPATTIKELEESTPACVGFELPSFVHEEDFLKLQPRKEVFSDAFVFHNLKHLELWTGFSIDEMAGMEDLFEKCPQLETMVLVSSYESFLDDDTDGPVRDVIEFSLPCLKSAEMRDFGATKNETHVLGRLIRHGSKLEKITVRPRKVDGRSKPSIVLTQNLDTSVWGVAVI